MIVSRCWRVKETVTAGSDLIYSNASERGHDVGASYCESAEARYGRCLPIAACGDPYYCRLSAGTHMDLQCDSDCVRT